MRPLPNCLAVAGVICGLALPASAQLLTEKNLSAAMAVTIAQTALETCTKQGYHVSVHVIGRSGEVLVAVRGDGAPPHTMENSQRKAYTARTFRVPSGEFAQRVGRENGRHPGRGAGPVHPHQPPPPRPRLR
jgi:heme-degrading protein